MWQTQSRGWVSTHSRWEDQSSSWLREREPQTAWTRFGPRRIAMFEARPSSLEVHHELWSRGYEKTYQRGHVVLVLCLWQHPRAVKYANNIVRAFRTDRAKASGSGGGKKSYKFRRDQPWDEIIRIFSPCTGCQVIARDTWEPLPVLRRTHAWDNDVCLRSDWVWASDHHCNHRPVKLLSFAQRGHGVHGTGCP